MLTYKAMYKFVDGDVHAQVLDFPGVITSADSLEEARRLLASALQDVAETVLFENHALPKPDASATDTESDLEEPIYLLLKASSHVKVVPSHEAA